MSPVQAASLLSRVPPIYLVAIAMIIGDGLGNLRLAVPIPITVSAAFAATILFLSACPRIGLITVLVAIAAAATIPAHDLLTPALDPPSIRRFPYGERIMVEGTLIREAEPYHGRTHLYVAVELAAGPGSAMRPARGVIRVTLLHPATYRVGERVRVTARIRFPRNYGNPGEFDYQAYQARQGIAATMVVTHGRANPSSIDVIGYQPSFPASQIESVRMRIGAFIDANLAHPEREEMRALIIGDRGGISDRLRNRFALTGMAHLLVISGLHLSFVAAAAFAAARLILTLFASLTIRGYSNKIAAIFAAIMVAAYASIAGHHVSTIRALVMVLAYLFAVIIDRPREVLASLALAALIICIALPGSTADIGFQLSFASVLVIVLGVRRFNAWWKARRELDLPGPESRTARFLRTLLGYVAVSFWAMVGTAPLTAYHFNQFSIVGLVANVVVVPIMGLGATVIGLVAAALSLVSIPLDSVLMRLAGRLLALGTLLARMFAALPMAWVRTFTPTIVELVIAYAMLALWLRWPLEAVDPGPPRRPVTPDPPQEASAISKWAGRLRQSSSLRARLRFAILGVLIVALAIDAAWWIYNRYFNPDLRVTFLSVGQGDSAVVRFPGSRVMLIDGGGQFGEFDPGQRIVAPYLWSRKIMHVDYMALSHPELDHFGGFEFIARNFHPEQFWTIAAPTPDVRYGDLLAALSKVGTRVRIVDSSFVPPSPDGVILKCFNPAPDEIASRNNSSMVLKLSFGPTSFLFTGDIEDAGERAVIGRVPEGLRATILKVPHHGSATSSSDEFIAKVHPSIAIISDGFHNRFNFPAPEVLRSYRAIGTRVLRTDLNGAIEIDTSRTGMTVRVPALLTGAN